MLQCWFSLLTCTCLFSDPLIICQPLPISFLILLVRSCFTDNSIYLELLLSRTRTNYCVVSSWYCILLFPCFHFCTSVLHFSVSYLHQISKLVKDGRNYAQWLKSLQVPWTNNDCKQQRFSLWFGSCLYSHNSCPAWRIVHDHLAACGEAYSCIMKFD